MKVTISELRSMIREALEERMMPEGADQGPEEMENSKALSARDLGSDTGNMEEATYNEGYMQNEEHMEESWHELEEAWNELEEVSGLHEAKEAKKEKEEKKPAKKEEPAKEQKKAGMNITKAQLMAALDLNPAQEIDFKRAINKGHSVADALAAATATKKKAAKKED